VIPLAPFFFPSGSTNKKGPIMADAPQDNELAGILPALKDLSFSQFITVSLVKFIYVLGLILLALGFVFAVFSGLSQGFGGIIYVLGAVIGFVLGVLWLRVTLEMVVVVFRIADNTAVIAKQARSQT
jgi:hypothetical protein